MRIKVYKHIKRYGELSNGKMYTVGCRTDDTLIYVGSTAEERLSTRLIFRKEKEHYKNNIEKNKGKITNMFKKNSKN